MKCLVISGGGSRGAAGAGKLAAISGNFDIGVAISTGSLMLVPALLNQHQLLKRVYTTIRPKDIFDFNPVDKKGHFKMWWVLLRLLIGKETVASTHVLRKTLDKIYTENNLWERLRSSKKVAYVGVYNTTRHKMEYVCSKSCTYQEWLDYTCASASAPPIMNILTKDSQEFVDGGVQVSVPIEFAATLNIDHLTVIALRPETLPDHNKKPTKNLIHNAARILEGMRRDVIEGDLIAGKLLCEKSKIDYDIHYADEGYGENSLLFDSKKMSAWYREARSGELSPQKGRF